jgi:hypothetical protein
MKTDTEYFHMAVDAWCKANKWSKDLPVTPSWFSDMLNNANKLKLADKARIEQAATT